MTVTSERTKLKQQILRTIQSYETIIIHRHVRPDPDAIGSQAGLAELLRASFPEKEVYAVGSTVENLTFLATMDDIPDEMYEDALVIITDTANEPRISDDRYRLGRETIKIDHHPDEDSYADQEWVQPDASSCSEMITELWQTFPETLKINPTAARLLYAGIVGDTNRFLYASTSPETMRMAARLMEEGFSHTEVNNQLNQITPAVAKMTGFVLENVIIHPSGAGYIILTKEVLDSYGLKDEDTHSVVPLPGKIEGVFLWCIFVEQEDGTFRCRLRSKGPVINQLAARHGGGGHALASGANAENLEEIEQILSEMDKLGIEWKEEHPII